MPVSASERALAQEAEISGFEDRLDAYYDNTLVSIGGNHKVLVYFGVSDPGCVRHSNEDRICMDPGLGLFVVSDGMGGHRNGELAAELVISTLRYYLDSSRSPADVTWPFGYNVGLSLPANRLVTGIRLANRQVWKKSEESPEFAGMGSTVAAVLVDGNHAAIGNVGDSRAYQFRRGKLTQLSIDDTWINSVFPNGSLDRASLLKHPMRNVLTQAAGSKDDPEVHTSEVELEPQDLLLLCSDGLHSFVPDEFIAEILSTDVSVEQKVWRLKDAAFAEGAPDNVSGVLVGYDSDL